MKKFILGLVLVLLFSALCTGCNAPGAFYSLDEAYDNGWLTQENLKNIAYYYNSYSAPDLEPDDTFIPEPIDPNQLDNQKIRKMKRRYSKHSIKDVRIPLRFITVVKYYGTYNECDVVWITDSYVLYDLLFEEEKQIGGVKFYNYCGAEISVWRVS